MSDYYPTGSMNGSGIYEQDYTGFFYCDTCEDEFELDGSTNDSGSMARAECPKCKDILEVEISNEQDDDDERHEAWRDSQLFD